MWKELSVDCELSLSGGANTLFVLYTLDIYKVNAIVTIVDFPCVVVGVSLR